MYIYFFSKKQIIIIKKPSIFCFQFILNSDIEVDGYIHQLKQTQIRSDRMFDREDNFYFRLHKPFYLAQLFGEEEYEEDDDDDDLDYWH